MPRIPQKRDAALAYVRALVDKLADQGGRRLPSLDNLAYEAGVSTRTMLSALNRLRTSGLIEARRGSGYFIRDTGAPDVAPTPPPVIAESPTLFRRLAWRIEDSIREGVYTPGDQLPPAKMLCDRFGASRPTVTKALRHLVQGGVLEHLSRGYRVAVPGAPPHARNAIALVTRGEPGGRVESATRRTQYHLRLLEQECARASLRLRVYSHPRTARFSALPFRSDPEPPLGTIVWSVGLQPWLQHALERLAESDSPIALLDESGGLPIRANARLRRLVRVFSIAHDRRDGIAAGRYLKQLGHRTIVYLSTYPDTEWASSRYEGLCEALGSRGRVHLLQAESPPEAQELIAKGRSLAQAAQQLLTTDISRSTAVLRSVERVGRGMRELLASSPALRDYHHAVLVPLLDRAAAITDATAWVAANDELAVECLLYCRERTIEIPTRLSLMGFNDGIESFTFGITSYNFNPTAVMRAMVAHTTSSPLAARARAHRSENAYGFAAEYIPGFVTERGSV